LELTQRSSTLLMLTLNFIASRRPITPEPTILSSNGNSRCFLGFMHFLGLSRTEFTNTRFQNQCSFDIAQYTSRHDTFFSVMISVVFPQLISSSPDMTPFCTSSRRVYSLIAGFQELVGNNMSINSLNGHRSVQQQKFTSSL